MYILNFLFFFSINNTKYPTNNYNGWIYPFLKFSLINFFKIKFFISINLYIKKNFSTILGFKSIL